MQHVLEVNLEDFGGAFSLMFQVQKQLVGKTALDYFSMASFKNSEIISEIRNMGGNVYCADLRKNRLLGHIMLPFVFYKFLQTHNYRTIHIHSDTAWKICLYAIPAKLAHVNKIIIHSHSSGVNGDYRGFKCIAHSIVKPLIPHVGTDFLTCSTAATLWMYGKNPKFPVTWIKNGVDTNKFQFSREARKQIRRRLDLGEEVIVIGTVGDLSYTKNPQYLTRILADLKKKSRNMYKLIFIGSGSDEQAVRLYVKEKNLEEDVIFYGNTNKVQEVLSALDVYVMPSRFEGLPVSVIEAEANGLSCVLSSEITSEVALDKDVSFLNLDDDVSEWTKNIEKFAAVKKERKNGAELVRSHGFDIQQTADMVFQIYRVVSEI